MSANTPVVLLVEDNPADVVLMQYAFKGARLTCPLVVARDGMQATDYITRACLDLNGEARPTNVLLDMILPLRNGLEVLGWIRSQPALDDLRVIAISAALPYLEQEKAEQLGIDGFFRKPPTARDL